MASVIETTVYRLDEHSDATGDMALAALTERAEAAGAWREGSKEQLSSY